MTKIAAGLALFLGMAAYCAVAMRISTEITFFLPDGEDPKLADTARQLLDSTLTRTMILSVEAADPVAAGKQLAANLRGDPEIAWLRAGPGPQVAEAFYKLFFPHRYQLLSGAPELELPKRFSDEGLKASLSRLKARLAQPMGSLFKRIAPEDPLQAFPELIQRLEAAREGSLQVVDDQFVSSDGRHAIVFLATRHSPFDSETQRPLLERIRAAAAGSRLEMSGVNRFAVDGERIVKADVNRISVVSTIGIVALFLLLFRSLRVLAISLVPLLFGLVTATSVCLLVYGSLHGLTLAFGATLLGVCIDYPILYLNHQVLEPAETPLKTLRRIRGALLLGALTTLGGFAGLGWTTFAGMRQMALFGTAGILGALAATWWLLPALVPARPAAVPLHRKLAEKLGLLLELMRGKRALLAVLPVLALGVCAAGLPRLRWADDLSSLQRPNPKLQAEDELVRSRVSEMDTGRFILAVGASEEEALQRNDAVHARLPAAKLDGFRSLHDLVFSADLQRRNLASLPPELFQRTAKALAGEGFEPAAFAPFEKALQSAPPPLKLSEVMESPLGDLVSPFRVQLGSQVGLLTFVRGVRDPAAVQALLKGIDGVTWFDQEQFYSQAYGRYRAKAQQLVIAGMILVFGLLFLAWRNLRLTLVAGVPAVLAAATALAILALAGVETNLLHVVSLVLVLGIGEDYAIFLVAHAKDPRELSASAMSVLLCCLSAALSFGLLGLSEIPALRAIGLTVGLGILLSLILAPTALVLADGGAGFAGDGRSPVGRSIGGEPS